MALDNVHDFRFGFIKLCVDDFCVFFLPCQAVGKSGISLEVGEFGCLRILESMRGGLENIVKVNFH